jgi:hypothetical protein
MKPPQVQKGEKAKHVDFNEVVEKSNLVMLG